MLESGNFLVPQVGGEDYFRKPPLINWAGGRCAQALRRPKRVDRPRTFRAQSSNSGAGFRDRRASKPGSVGSLVAAVVWLTNVAILQKGRLIEIEALYTSLTAIAVILWLSWWREGRSPWLTWVVPWIFLGLGWLAKGPTHLLFFYAIVIAVLWQSRQWRLLYHPAHIVGILADARHLRRMGDSTIARQRGARRGPPVVDSIHRPGDRGFLHLQRMDHDSAARASLICCHGSYSCR